MASARSRLLQWKDAESSRAWGNDPADLDPTALQAVVRGLRPIFHGRRAYFPTRVDGWDRIPDAPTLVVGNHSGGTSIPDTWGFGVAWYEHFGTTRPMHALAHEMVFALDGVGRRFAKIGILRASRDMARTVLHQHRRDLMVYPGGDLDTWRPWTDRYQVRFAGRTGYARLAVETGVPIVPVAHAGSHDTLVVLTDGRRVAEALRFPELFRAHIFPVHLSLPFGVGIGPLPHLPPPTPLRYRFGRAVVPPRWLGEGPPPDALVADVDRQVRASLQAELDILRDEHEGLRDRVRHLADRVRRRVRNRRDRAVPLAAK